MNKAPFQGLFYGKQIYSSLLHSNQISN